MPGRPSPLSRYSAHSLTRRADLAAYTWIMGVQWEELLQLIEELPEEEVTAAPDDVRRHLRPVVKARPWPRPGSEQEKARQMMSPLGLKIYRETDSVIQGDRL
jgi:hypothetical protein